MDDAVLTRLGLTRQMLGDALVEYDIARHGLATLARETGCGPSGFCSSVGLFILTVCGTIAMRGFCRICCDWGLWASGSRPGPTPATLTRRKRETIKENGLRIGVFGRPRSPGRGQGSFPNLWRRQV